jgi:quinol monooxygenase YgiN
MIHVAIRMLIPPKQRGEAMETLSSLADWSRFEGGCISCRVYRDVEVESAILIVQLWKSREALERYLRTEEFQQVLLLLEMAVEPPEIWFDEISRSSGMETIEKARSQAR